MGGGFVILFWAVARGSPRRSSSEASTPGNGLVRVFTYLVAEWLVDNYGRNAIATEVLDNCLLHLVPMANPDGHEYSVTTYRLWRKNSPAGDPDYQATPGGPALGVQAGAPESVDVNRNFHGANRATVIASGRGSFSTNPDDDTYAGVSGGSSFEASRLEALMIRENFDAVLDVHSHGCFVMHSPGDDPRRLSAIHAPTSVRYNQFTSNMHALITTAAATHFTTRPGTPDTWTLEQASHFYATLWGVPLADSLVPGGSMDFAFYHYLAVPPAARGPHRTLGLAMELPPMHYAGSPGFDLPESAIRPVFRMVLGSVLALVRWGRHPSPTAADFARFRTVP